MMSVERSRILAICFAIMVTSTSQTSIFVILPPIGRALGLGDLQVSSIGTISALVYVISALQLGRASERIGRAPLIIIGLIFTALSNWISAVVIDAGLAGRLSGQGVYLVVLASRVAASISWGGLLPSAQAYIADTVAEDKRTRSIAAIAASFGIGTVSGPAIAWLSTPLGSSAPFALIGILATIATLMIAVVVRDRSKAATRMITETGLLRPHNLPKSLREHLMASTMIIISLCMVQQVMPFLFQDSLDLSGTEATKYSGAALTAMAIFMVSTQILIAVRGNLWRPNHILLTGSLIGIVGTLALTASGILAPENSYFVKAAAMCLLGVGLGLMLPANAALVSLSAPARSQGAAAGMMSSARGIGGMIGPVLGTELYLLYPVSPFLLIGVIFAVLAVLSAAMKSAVGSPPRSA